MRKDLGQRFLIVERDRSPTPNTVLLGGDRRGGVPAQAVSSLVKGQPTPDVKASGELPEQPSAGLGVRHVEVVVGDEQPAKVLSESNCQIEFAVDLFAQCAGLPAYHRRRVVRFAGWACLNGRRDDEHVGTEHSSMANAIKGLNRFKSLKRW